MAAKQIHLWTWSGNYFGFREGDDLWTYRGQHVGRFRGNDVFAADGRYLGEMDGARLLAKTANKGLRGDPFAPPPPRSMVRALSGQSTNTLYPGYQDFPKF